VFPELSGLIGGVSLAVGIICLVAGILIWVFGNHAWPRLVVALIITGSVGLTASPVGQWVAGVINTGDQLVGSIIGKFTGAVVAGLLAFTIIAYLAFRLYQNRIDDRTLIAASVAPPAAALIPGAAGQIVMTIISIPAALIASGVSWVFGV